MLNLFSKTEFLLYPDGPHQYLIESMKHFEEFHFNHFPLLVRAEFAFTPIYNQTANNYKELKEFVQKALDASPTSRVFIYSVQTSLGELLDALYHDTAIHSSPTPALNHPNYAKVIAYGDLALRYILLKLVAGEARWHHFSMLRELTNENPTPPEHAGYYDKIVNDWIEWGKANNKLDQLALDLLIPTS